MMSTRRAIQASVVAAVVGGSVACGDTPAPSEAQETPIVMSAPLAKSLKVSLDDARTRIAPALASGSDELTVALEELSAALANRNRRAMAAAAAHTNKLLDDVAARNQEAEPDVNAIRLAVDAAVRTLAHDTDK